MRVALLFSVMFHLFRDGNGFTLVFLWTGHVLASGKWQTYFLDRTSIFSLYGDQGEEVSSVKVTAIFQSLTPWPSVGGTTGTLLHAGGIRRFPPVFANWKKKETHKIIHGFPFWLGRRFVYNSQSTLVDLHNPGIRVRLVNVLNPSAWGHLNPSSYCDVGRLFYGVFKLWSKLQRKKWKK